MLKRTGDMAGETRATKRARYTGKTVTIRAGIASALQAATTIPAPTANIQDDFQIHEEVLKQSSPYFRTALEVKREDGAARILTASWATAFDVGAYVDWCYSGQIACQEASSGAVDSPHFSSEFRDLARLYVFGEKIEDARFCNAVMTAFTQLCDQSGFAAWKTLAAMVWIYGGTPKGSPARRFLVDVWQGYGKEDWLANRWSDTVVKHPEFLVDLAAGLYRRDFQRTAGDKFFPCRFRWFKTEQE